MLTRLVAALMDTVAAPAPPLPPVERTDAVAAFGQWIAASPPLNRAGLRVALALLELAPLLLGSGARFSRLDRPGRTVALRRLDRGRLHPLVRALTGMLLVSYYGDDGVMRLLGYDAGANVERGRRLIASEGRQSGAAAVATARMAGGDLHKRRPEGGKG